MDIVIALVILIISVSVVFGKPVQIVITHKYEKPPAIEAENLNTIQRQMDDDSAALTTMDTVIQSLNKIMGVNTGGENDSTT